MAGRHDHPAPPPECGHRTIPDGISTLQYCAKCDVVHCSECKVEWGKSAPIRLPSWPMGNVYNAPAYNPGPACAPTEYQEPARTQFVCEHH